MHRAVSVTQIGRSDLLKLLNLFSLTAALLFGNLAHASCEEIRAFEDVKAQTQRFLTNGGLLTQTERLALGEALKRIDPSSLKTLLTQRDLSIYGPFLSKMLADLEWLQRTGRGSTADFRAQDMRLAEQIFDELCEIEEASEEPLPKTGKSRALGLITFSFENAFRMGSAPDVRSYFNLSLVFFVLLGTISLIVFSWKAYVIAFTLLTSRRSCRIAATLKLPEAEILGHITVLDVQELRFLPEESADGSWLVKHLKKQASLPKTSFEIHGTNFVVNLKVVQRSYCATRLETSLERKILSELFAHSTEPPRYVSRSSARSNLAELNPRFV